MCVNQHPKIKKTWEDFCLNFIAFYGRWVFAEFRKPCRLCSYAVSVILLILQRQLSKLSDLYLIALLFPLLLFMWGFFPRLFLVQKGKREDDDSECLWISGRSGIPTSILISALGQWYSTSSFFFFFSPSNPRCNFSSNLYPQSCRSIIQLIHIL